MKRYYQVFFFSMLAFGTSFAQTNVYLQIEHLLADESFEMNMGSKNNMGHDFNITRLQYYISGITVTHDGGVETSFPETYILVNAANETNVEIGDADIDQVEKIKFYIGVDQGNNHADPALFPNGHPLAPKFPSMHWGWAAGYRFLALEGNGGSRYNQLVQLHGLGDGNYFSIEMALAPEKLNNEVVIGIKADYTRALENISVNGGVIVHSETGESQTALENFRDFVFSPATGSTSSDDIIKDDNVNVYPNPSFNGSTTIDLGANHLIYQIEILNISGQLISSQNVDLNDASLDVFVALSGRYILKLNRSDGNYIIKTLTIK